MFFVFPGCGFCLDNWHLDQGSRQLLLKAKAIFCRSPDDRTLCHFGVTRSKCLDIGPLTPDKPAPARMDGSVFVGSVWGGSLLGFPTGNPTHSRNIPFKGHLLCGKPCVSSPGGIVAKKGTHLWGCYILWLVAMVGWYTFDWF